MDTMTRPRTLSMSTLMDEPVRNMQGQNIGQIEDYMVDLQGGCVEYAVLSFGGFLGIGEKLFAIPWDSMQLDTENHAWMLDVSKERLQQAPGFDRDNWPDLGDTDYRKSLSTFWTVNASAGREDMPYRGVKDTEADYGMQSSGMQSGGMESSGMQSSGGQMYGRRHDDMPRSDTSQGTYSSAGDTGMGTMRDERPLGAIGQETYGTTGERPYGRRRDDY